MMGTTAASSSFSSSSATINAGAGAGAPPPPPLLNIPAAANTSSAPTAAAAAVGVAAATPPPPIAGWIWPPKSCTSGRRTWKLQCRQGNFELQARPNDERHHFRIIYANFPYYYKFAYAHTLEQADAQFKFLTNNLNGKPGSVIKNFVRLIEDRHYTSDVGTPDSKASSLKGEKDIEEYEDDSSDDVFYDNNPENFFDENDELVSANESLSSEDEESPNGEVEASIDYLNNNDRPIVANATTVAPISMPVLSKSTWQVPPKAFMLVSRMNWRSIDRTTNFELLKKKWQDESEKNSMFRIITRSFPHYQFGISTDLDEAKVMLRFLSERITGNSSKQIFHQFAALFPNIAENVEEEFELPVIEGDLNGFNDTVDGVLQVGKVFLNSVFPDKFPLSNQEKSRAVTYQDLRRQHQRKKKIIAISCVTVLAIILRYCSLDSFVVLLILLSIGIIYYVEHQAQLNVQLLKGSLTRKLHMVKRVANEKVRKTKKPPEALDSANPSPLTFMTGRNSSRASLTSNNKNPKSLSLSTTPIQSPRRDTPPTPSNLTSTTSNKGASSSGANFSTLPDPAATTPRLSI